MDLSVAYPSRILFTRGITVHQEGKYPWNLYPKAHINQLMYNEIKGMHNIVQNLNK